MILESPRTRDVRKLSSAGLYMWVFKVPVHGAPGIREPLPHPRILMAWKCQVARSCRARQLTCWATGSPSWLPATQPLDSTPCKQMASSYTRQPANTKGSCQPSPATQLASGYMAGLSTHSVPGVMEMSHKVIPHIFWNICASGFLFCCAINCLNV